MVLFNQYAINKINMTNGECIPMHKNCQIAIYVKNTMFLGCLPIGILTLVLCIVIISILLVISVGIGTLLYYVLHRCFSSKIEYTIIDNDLIINLTEIK